MWYVVQVRSGTEHNIRIQCNKKIPDAIMERCFIPYYEEKKKQNGTWNTLQKVLFFHLKTIEGMTKLIGTGQDIIPLKEEEITFLKRFGGEEQIVSMSEGIIEGTQVIITSGPLMGMEGLIQKIDRHKRKAWLDLELFGRMQQVEVGLEITRKV